LAAFALHAPVVLAAGAQEPVLSPIAAAAGAPTAPEASPFTGAPAPSAAPLPPAPPAPADAAPVDNRALPVAPAPRAEAVAQPPGAPGNDLPLPPPPPRGVRSHDGFYLRMALGLGASGALVSTDSTRVPNYSFNGGGGAGDIWIGGTPVAGLVLGGALSVLSLKSTTRRVSGDSQSGDVTGNTGILGIFVDGFPNPDRGFHFGGTIGLAGTHTDVKGNDSDTFNGGGVGLGAWLGYDMWVGEQWSLGGMVRFTGSLTHENRDDVNYQTSLGGASLSFTALYQ
jgi:hypothetical protein